MSDELYELPDGWRWTTIGEACRVNERNPKLRKLADDLPVSFVPMAAVDAELGVIATPQVRPLKEVKKGFTPFSDGDVIFAKITPSMENGKAAIARNLTNQLGFGSTEFHVMRPKDKVLPEWVFHYIRRQEFRNEAKGNFAGTAGQLRVPDGFVRNAPIPIAPLPEQHRIIEKIQKLLAESHTARVALDKVPAMLKHFRQSVLAKAFRGELTERDPTDEPASVLLERIQAERRKTWEAEKGGKRKKYINSEPPDMSALPELPEGWVWTTIEEIGSLTDEAVKTGPFGAQLSSKEFTNEGVPILAIGNVQWGQLALKRQDFVTETKANELADYRLKPGDVLFTRSGTVGRSAVVPNDADGWLMSYHLLRVRVDRRTCLPIFLYYVFRGEAGIQEAITERARGATRAGFNTSLLKTLPIPLAPLAEQHRIVAKIESLFAQAEAIERAVEIARRRAEKVDQAVLARAFRGNI